MGLFRNRGVKMTNQLALYLKTLLQENHLVYLAGFFRTVSKVGLLSLYDSNILKQNSNKTTAAY